jgi:DNA-binding NarL/FixJ family response regulator
LRVRCGLAVGRFSNKPYPEANRSRQTRNLPSPVLVARETAAKRVTSLTARQRQILDLVLAGHPSKNIAADLGISQRTVDNHTAAFLLRRKSDLGSGGDPRSLTLNALRQGTGAT